MFKPEELTGECGIVFEYCRKAWDISNIGMAELIKRYDLGNRFIEFYGWYSGMGIQGVEEKFKEYIKSEGGSIS